MVTTPSSAQRELQQQAAEMEFILSNFFESVCEDFKPTANNASVYFYTSLIS